MLPTILAAQLLEKRGPKITWQLYHSCSRPTKIQDQELLDKFGKRCEYQNLQLGYYESAVIQILSKQTPKMMDMIEEASQENSSRLLDAEEKENPLIMASFHIGCKIEDAGRTLSDGNVKGREMFFLANTVDKIFRRDDQIDAWMSLLESSQVPLAVKLREQLKEAGLTNKDFATSIVDVYLSVLQKYDLNSWDPAEYGPKEITSVLEELKLKPEEFKSVRILLNLDESEKWQI